MKAPSKSANVKNENQYEASQGQGMAKTGTILTCTNDECACRLRIEEPCPHGDTYTCACGHPFVTASAPLDDEPS